MRMLFTCLVAAAALAATATNAEAATATANMGVSLTISAQCTVVSASTMAFPNTGLLNANVDQTSTITVLCTNTTPYNISLDKGLFGASVSARLMQGTGGSPDT